MNRESREECESWSDLKRGGRVVWVRSGFGRRSGVVVRRVTLHSLGTTRLVQIHTSRSLVGKGPPVKRVSDHPFLHSNIVVSTDTLELPCVMRGGWGEIRRVDVTTPTSTSTVDSAHPELTTYTG